MMGQVYVLDVGVQQACHIGKGFELGCCAAGSRRRHELDAITAPPGEWIILRGITWGWRELADPG